MPRMTLRTGLMLAALAGLGGCAYINHDLSHAPGMEAVVGKRFTTLQDAALIGDACIPDYAAKHCQQLQVTGGYYYARGSGQGWHQVRVPANSTTVAAAAAAGGKLNFVPKGAVVTVVQLESKDLGIERRCWVIYATLAGLPADTVAELPGCFEWAPDSTPLWFEAQELPHKKYEPLQYDYLHLPPLPNAAILIPTPAQ